MTKNLITISIVLLAVLMLSSGPTLGQTPGPPPGQTGQPGPGPKPRCPELFKILDTNHDGKVTLDEFKAAHHMRDAEQTFKAMDTQGKGYLTQEDLCGKGKMHPGQ
ncbi:MAG: EF-hand domain-containing protein [Deltaproteobacteria bacterium]|nr:EF-hand domain-containing protein [Deltaproteobacteria bacterium]